jgi:hypothetical protein
VHTIEERGSADGTYVYRSRFAAGQKCALGPGDWIQVATVQLSVTV